MREGAHEQESHLGHTKVGPCIARMERDADGAEMAGDPQGRRVYGYSSDPARWRGNSRRADLEHNARVEKGFVMDVIQNYTTYKRFCALLTQIEHDPDVPRRQAAQALTRYPELHPVNIEQVVSVIVEHFQLFVMHELGGRAQAMVVTGSLQAAVKYKLACDRYLKEQGYTGIRALGAFSGAVVAPEDPGSAYTEVALHDSRVESQLPASCGRYDYWVLLVAENYHTGFVPPLLQTMYVVKRLAGVPAVQTLSRLNRAAPGKVRTFILDFVNEADDIYQAFKPYSGATPVGEHADPPSLLELQHRLRGGTICTRADVTGFAAVWYRAQRAHSVTDHRQMHAILDAVVQRFQERGEYGQAELRGQLTAYRDLYAFLSQIIPYQDTDLERLYAFVRNLLAKLPPRGDGQACGRDDEVALRFFRLQQLSDGSIDLRKAPLDVGTGRAQGDKVPRSRLIDRLNTRFGTAFTEADQLFFDQIRAAGEHDENIAEAARTHSFKDFAAYLDRRLDDLFSTRMEGNAEIFSRVTTDTEFRSAAQAHLAGETFRRVRKQQDGE